MSPHTVTAYDHDMRQFLTFQTAHLGKKIAEDDLSILSIRELRAWLANRRSHQYDPRSTARAISVVRSFFKFLQKNGFTPNAAIDVLRSPRVKIGLPRPLSVDQAAIFLANIHDDAIEFWVGLRNKALFTMLYGCGLRISEALDLTTKQAPLSTDLLLIQGKGNRERLVPVLPIVSEALAAYIKACPFPLDPDGPLFIGTQGKKLNPGIAQKAMRDYRRFHGLAESATPHALRHSYATHLMATSGDLRGIQELLGHVSLSTTQVYTDVDTAQLMKVYQKAHPRSQKS